MRGWSSTRSGTAEKLSRPQWAWRTVLVVDGNLADWLHCARRLLVSKEGRPTWRVRFSPFFASTLACDDKPWPLTAQSGLVTTGALLMTLEYSPPWRLSHGLFSASSVSSTRKSVHGVSGTRCLDHSDSKEGIAWFLLMKMPKCCGSKMMSDMSVSYPSLVFRYAPCV